MHAVVRREALAVTDSESLVDEIVPVAAPTGHDVLIRVEAVSVNPVDVKVRGGGPASPAGRILGFDGAGTVVAVGPETTLFSPGDDVWWAGALTRPGSNAEFQLVDERIVGRKPTTLEWADAAALPLTAITAWETLFDRLALTPESTGTLLIAGATGGVGSIMLQLVRAVLPHVHTIATASRPAGDSWVRSLGADAVVNHRSDLAAQVLEIAPDGIDWVFTGHSRGQVEAYASIVKPFGHIVAIDDEKDQDLSVLKPKSIAWHWELMFTRSLFSTPDMIEQHLLLDQLADLVDAGHVMTTATTRLTGIDAATLREAHGLVEAGTIIGKVVIARS